MFETEYQLNCATTDELREIAKGRSKRAKMAAFILKVRDCSVADADIAQARKLFA